MNYIAHIQLAEHSNTSKLGNFLGDFIKGDQYLALSSSLQQGVLLHRKIDTYTDSHEIVLDLKRKTPKPLKRMSGVIIDIFFDHLLCKHWSQYCSNSFDDVMNDFYKQLRGKLDISSTRFLAVQNSLLRDQWLAAYHEMSTLKRVFIQIENRLNNRIQFADIAVDWVESEYQTINAAFAAFYPQLQDFSAHTALKFTEE